MLPSKHPRTGARRFLLGASLAFLIGFCSVAFLNWWQNPFYAFRQLLPHISERPPGAILGADRERQMRWLIREGNQVSAGTLLIGSSQMLIGMDTCSYPQTKRLALFFLTDDEIARLLRADVPTLKQRTTFVIGRGISAEATAPPPLTRLHALWRDLFGQQATHTSLLNLYQSIVPGPRPCAVVDYSTHVPDALSPETIDKTLRLVNEHLAPASALQGIFNAIEPSCRGLHHDIVLVHLPIMFSPHDVPALLLLEQQQSRLAQDSVDAFNHRNTGCSARFRDLATPYTMANQISGPDHDHWFDTLHFKPDLGRTFLRTILAPAEDTADAGGQ